MNKRIFKTVLHFFSALFLTIIICNSSPNVAMAATGLNMNGTTIRGYAYSNSNFAVYDRTDNYKKIIGTCYGSSDLITISGVGRDGWSKITYPAGRFYKTGYCQTSYLFQNINFSGNTGRVSQNITTYSKPNCNYRYGMTTTGDNVFIVGYSNGNTQILYPCTKYYKVAWVRGQYVIENGKFNKLNIYFNPQGCFDRVLSNNSNTITVDGWTFDRDNLNAQLQIHVYVGGPAGSGAPGYAITANTYRPDVNKVYPGVGNYHGFSSTIKVSKTGNQTIYVYAINIGGGSNVLLGTKNVYIKGNTTTTVNSNIAQKIVNYELSQVGVGDQKGNNNVPYNTWYYGKVVSGSGYAWCMAFQAYSCYAVTGSNNAIPKTASCTAAVNIFKNRGQFKYSNYYGGNYIPKAGDLVFYTNGSRNSSCHVGMITSTPVNGYLQTIEGNIQCSDKNWKVVRFTNNSKRKTNSSYVLGYATPVY